MTLAQPIYLDNQATTRVDPRVVEAMLPYWTEQYGNSGSTSHVFGWQAKAAVDAARKSVANSLGTKPSEIIFASGATECNNLAIRGAVARRQAPGKHIISVQTEHRAVLDPLERLSRDGYDITYLPVSKADAEDATSVGTLDPEQLRVSLRPNTALVSVMLANNEIGTLQPLAQIAEICREHPTLLHCDATQAVGKIPLNLTQLGADLVSFSAHKMYGPKGVGALYVARRSPQIRLVPLVDGGGQEKGMRSGTLAVPLIVGLASALELCCDEMATEIPRLHQLRERLHHGLSTDIPNCHLNGPAWIPLDAMNSACTIRLPHNLNLQFESVEGESLMLSASELAVSSGSACTSTNPEPSHVLRAIGLSDDQIRCSLRFGLGRFTTEEEIDRTIQILTQAVDRLRKLR